MLLQPTYPSRSTAAHAGAGVTRAAPGGVREQAGFTLIELLIVCLIVGILVAIAIPTFVRPQEDAVGAQAKSLVGSAATAVEAYAADNSGSYEGLTPGRLHSEEPGIAVATSPTDAYISRAKGTDNGYTLTAHATNGDEFTLTDTAGAMTRTCVSTLTATGCSGAKTSSW